MASALGICRLILHIFAVLVSCMSMAITVTSIFTTGWQMYSDSDLNQVHQHGLWFDYVLAKHHSGKQELKWHWSYKFGQAAQHDSEHHWKPYQYNTLLLLIVATFLSFIATIISCMAPYFVVVALIWTFISLWPASLSLAGVVLFFLHASAQENNYVFTEDHHDLVIGYSFYFSLIGMVGYIVALAATIGATIIDILLLIRGQRPREKYLKVNTRPVVENGDTRITSKDRKDFQSTLV